METRTKNTARNLFFGFINKFITIILPFILRTVMINTLASEYLGLNSLFTSILQVLNLAELGFSSAIIYNMYKPIAKNDKKTICALLNLYKKIYRIIGSVILIGGLCLLPFLHNFINGTYPSDANIYILYVLYLANSALSYFLFAYKSALLTAHQRNDVVSKVQTLSLIIQYSIQAFILLFLKNYYLFIAVCILCTIINNTIVMFITNKMYPEYKCDGEVSDIEKKSIRKKVTGLMIQKICATTRNSFDSIFISSFLGLTIVAIYSNYYSVLNAVISFLGIISVSIVASIGNSIVLESKEKNYNDMKKFNFMYMWISGLATVLLLCLFQPFMKLWMGDNYLLPLSSVILLSLYFYSLKLGDIRSAYFEAVGLWYEGRFRALLETIVNIVLNYFLGKYFGVNGIILATIISIILVNFCYGSTIIFKYYFTNVSVIDYFKSQLYYSFATLVACVISFMICNQIDINPIMQIVVNVIVCLFISNFIYILFYRNKKEYIESKKFINRLFSKKEEVKKHECI